MIIKKNCSVSAFAWLALNFMGYFCAFGVLQPFFPMWLKYHDYSESIIALLMSSAYFLRFGGGLLLANKIHDSSQILPRIRWVTLGTVLMAVLIAIFADNIYLLIPVVWLFYGLNGGVMPLNETAATAWQRQIGLDYGRARLCGSAAYIVGALIAGNVATYFGTNILIYLIILFLMIQFLVQFLNPIPHLSNQTNPNNLNNQNNSNNYLDLLKQKNIQKMLLAVSLIQGSHAAYYTYGVIFWQTKHISEQVISLMWGVSVLAEIILFFFSRNLFKNQDINFLMKCAATCVIIRWIGIAYFDNPIILLLINILHAGTFGLSHYAMVRFIGEQAPENMAKLQALYIGCASCAGVAILTLISGILVKISFPLAFLTMSVIGVIAWFLLTFLDSHSKSI